MVHKKLQSELDTVSKEGFLTVNNLKEIVLKVKENQKSGFWKSGGDEEDNSGESGN